MGELSPEDEPMAAFAAKAAEANMAATCSGDEPLMDCRWRGKPITRRGDVGVEVAVRGTLTGVAGGVGDAETLKPMLQTVIRNKLLF